MKAKGLIESMVARNLLRHRQHHRFLQNLALQLRHFGRARGLLIVMAIAAAGALLQKRNGAGLATRPPR